MKWDDRARLYSTVTSLRYLTLFYLRPCLFCLPANTHATAWKTAHAHSNLRPCSIRLVSQLAQSDAELSSQHGRNQNQLGMPSPEILIYPKQIPPLLFLSCVHKNPQLTVITPPVVTSQVCVSVGPGD